MQNERWQKIVEIFEQALEMPDGERAEYLNEICNGDSDLREEVDAMLVADADADDFIESPIIANATLSSLKTIENRENNIPEEEDLIGTRIGSFELISELGRGGMGAVYLAKRADGEFDQLVAIKLLRFNQ